MLKKFLSVLVLYVTASSKGGKYKAVLSASVVVTRKEFSPATFKTLNPEELCPNGIRCFCRQLLK